MNIRFKLIFLLRENAYSMVVCRKRERRREAAECEKINLRAQSERNPKYRFIFLKSSKRRPKLHNFIFLKLKRRPKLHSLHLYEEKKIEESQLHLLEIEESELYLLEIKESSSS
uniref:Uncharacterized protein n=1 Tax=Solanum tuberosum TaxID=4113 RepID=M1BJ85_SOLTU